MKLFLIGLLSFVSISSFAGALTKQVSVSAVGTDCAKANIKLDKVIKEASKNQKVIETRLFECQQQSYDDGGVEYKQGANLIVEINSVIGNY